MLTQITDIEWLTNRINGLLKAGVTANMLPDKERLQQSVCAGTLYAINYEEGLLLIERRPSHDYLSYILRRDAALPQFIPERDTVTEIPYRSGDGRAAAIAAQWETNGFATVLSRVRLTRRAAECPPAAPSVRFAAPDDFKQVSSLLAATFPEKTGCLPSKEALQALIEKKQILCTEKGVLHYEVSGRTSELRHLAVAENARGNGLGTLLVNSYLSICGANLCRVWTGQNNTAALSLYRKAGFSEDGWLSQVKEYRKD